MVSMQKMQALQPEVKAIQDRYAKYKVTDPERQKMNQEMMALYKQKGVNPASGCVPMLLTMPILFAFYAMLSVAIELRGAPFFGWIHDLSVHDPFYITPVVMGATMFWQQWMTPSTADPMQKKIFMLMPIIFTLTFLALPDRSRDLLAGQQPAGDRPAVLTNRLIGRARLQSRETAPKRAPEVGAKRVSMSDLDAKVIDFVQQVTGAMGLDARGRRRGDAGQHPAEPRPATGADVAARRKGEALDALQVIVNTVVPPRRARRSPLRRRRARLPQGQGRRAAPDGAIPHGEGADDRRRRRRSARSIPYARRIVHLDGGRGRDARHPRASATRFSRRS